MGDFGNPALVIGGGVTSLGIIRNLGSQGIDVYSAVDRNDIDVYSKYCVERYIFPGVGYELEKLRTFLKWFLNRFEKEVVIFPSSDISLRNLDALRDSLDHCIIQIPSSQVLAMVLEKRPLYKSLELNNVPYPATYFQDVDTIEEISTKISYPVFIKPSFSQDFANVFKKKAFIAHEKKDLYEYLGVVKEHSLDVMVQEIVPGPATNHIFIDGYLDRSSKPLALFARRRIKMWPPFTGNSTVCEGMPLSDVSDTLEDLLRYLGKIGYHGIFSAEFKKDSRDNEYKLLEINTRPWWYNLFPSDCGVNIILAAYLDSIGEPMTYPWEYESDKFMIYFVEDMRNLATRLMSGDFNSNEWITPLFRKKSWVVMSKKDPKPFTIECLRMLGDFISKEKIGRLREISESV